jgi:hypothetical protein
MNARALDPQRARLYRAEDAAFAQEKLEELDALQLVANDLVSSAWFRARYPHLRSLVVTHGRGSRDSRAGTDGRSIRLKQTYRYRHSVVHETAHHVDPTGTEDHGTVFAGLYLFMVGRFYGQKMKKRLAYHFRRWDVIWDCKVAAYGRP